MPKITGQWRAKSADAITFRWRDANGVSVFAGGSFNPGGEFVDDLGRRGFIDDEHRRFFTDDLDRRIG